MKTVFKSIIILLLLLVFVTAKAQSYIFAQLKGSPVNASGWTFSGSAQIGNIKYNDNSEVIICPNQNWLTGAVFYNQPINLSKCNRWTAEFDFRIYDGTGADGLAFCFLDTPPTGYVVGGGMGIPATANGLKICFDQNPNCPPYDRSLMPKIEIRWGSGYDECWSQPTKDNSDGSLSFIRSDAYNHAKITYDAGNINVYVNNVLYVSGFQQFNFTGYLGFTAATGALDDNHSIRNAVIYTDIPPSEAGNNQTVCSGQSVSLGTAANAGYVYQWTPVQGLNFSTVSNPTLTLINNGNNNSSYTYYVQTALAGSAACSSKDSVIVTVLPSLPASVSISASAINITAGTPVTFTATTVNLQPPVSYQWYKNNQLVGSNAAIYTDYNLNNNDSVWILVKGTNSCNTVMAITSTKIVMSVTTPSCTGSVGDVILNETFGAGPPNMGPALPNGITNNIIYTASVCLNDGYYSIVDSSSNCGGQNWHNIKDHTGDANGYFMMINASYNPSIFYTQTVNGLCDGTTYQFSAWAVNMDVNKNGILPNITFNIKKIDSTIIDSYATDTIPVTNPAEWKQYKFYFTTPPGVSSVILQMRNNAPGGFGNDLGLDDITFRPVGPQTSINIENTQADSITTCNSVKLISSVEKCYASNQYQWQVSVNGSAWTDINGATDNSYTVPVNTAGNYKYRLTVSQQGNFGNINCRVNSDTVTITVPPKPTVINGAATICYGKSYILPWGGMVDTSGYYSDTLHYTFGCDSVIKRVQLTVQSLSVLNKNASICYGGSYVLLSGKTVTSAGFYSDTLKHTGGCDSVIENINLIVKPLITNLKTDIFCRGSAYLLPWGKTVKSAGTYYDTLRYLTGCDSLINTVQLTEAPQTINNFSASLCEGSTYILPWGKTVNVAGVYSDTLHYLSGCDSLITNVSVNKQSPVYSTLTQPICPGQAIQLPSGAFAKAPGLYNDTLRSPTSGCDSIITALTLFQGTAPPIIISKSNDVSCGYGISKLSASGGKYYVWSPAGSIDNIYSSQPTVTPSANTVYHVKVTTAEGCSGEDSIAVYVLKSNGNINMPNAFTPNNDGVNDCFGVKYLGAISNLRFSVYNRWGQLVFYTTNPSECWDGNYKGLPLKTDTFIYEVSGKLFCGNIFQKGTIVLIR